MLRGNSVLSFFVSWEQRKLGEIANVYDGTHQTPNYKNEGIMFLSVENIKNLPPERIVFGGKKLYSEKDTVGITKSAEDNKTSQKALKEWKQEFFEKRHQSMALPGPR